MTDSQIAVLKEIGGSSKIETAEFDQRTINSLVGRELITVIENKKGVFAKITKDGRKVLKEL